MKKIIKIVILCFVCMFGCVSCSPSYNNKHYDSSKESAEVPAPTSSQYLKEEISMENNCILVVKGEDITAKTYVHLYEEAHYAELPLVAIMNTLGATIEWKSDILSTILYEGKTYLLNIDECTLVVQGGSINILTTPPGGERHYRTMEKELIVDSVTIRGLFHIIGVTLSLDYDSKLIEIS